MESVNFLKFWKHHATGQEEEEEEEDSFIDLELLSVNTADDRKIADQNGSSDENSMEDKKRVGFKENRQENPTKLSDHINLCSYEQKQESQSFDVSQTDSISKRKILPIEPSSKTQSESPIHLLKSAPKFPISIFKKQKSMPKNRTEETEEPRKSKSKAFNSKLIRENSTRKIGNISDDPSGNSSKRVSMEMVQKYLKLIKPLYERVLKKHTDNTTSTGDPSSTASPAAASVVSPFREKRESLPAGIRSVCKHLGKSKSASAAATGVLAASSVLSRRDDSLLQQHDGIQGAILHCKRSFNASAGFSLQESMEERA